LKLLTRVFEQGVIEMVIKIYRSGSNPHFNQGGIMTQYLEQLEIGSTLRVKGPEGHLHYQARGILTVHGHPIRVRRISMIAGGTGITPMYQLIKAILDDPDDTTELALVYSNHTLNDILLKGELDELAQQHHNFKLWYTVSDSPGPEWKFGVGRIDEKMLHEHLFVPGSGSVALVCGPPAMVSLSALPMLEKIGFKDDATFEF
jgi:nitrate reductase (NAD(P)H)